MKTNISPLKATQFFFYTLLILPFFFLFFSSCEKEPVYVETPVEVPVDEPTEDPTDVEDRPDEVNDMVAFLHPLHGALFVYPEYVDIALSKLDAQPTSAGGYEMKWLNPDGEEIFISFFLEVVEPPMVYEISADVDPKNPDLIHEFKAHGTSFRMYKNAKCGPVKPAFDSDCEPREDGTSVQRNWYASGNCVRGDSLCTEILAVGGKQVTYLNANCQGPIKSEENIYLWTCR